ncbi:DUF7351 domain-containing protein [Halomontanus rarus]|uniref:DUF7351 domain-containing protein n=1 Tax=Halomontanus rarus TaxID=3034020 RepID=UPI00293B9E8B|nr:ArsR family transcriptional regulator [Halovivax sp. KZCA124]
MTDLESGRSKLGALATDAFSVLSNETRLLTLLALWEVHDPFADQNAIPFSELYDRVNADDTGNFNYHLGKLSDGFVVQGDGGYELSEAGLSLVQAVIAGSAIRTSEHEATRINESCPHCGAPVRLAYPGEYVRVTCTECAGWFEWEGITEGGIVAFPLPPAGLDGRSLEEVLHTMVVYQLNRVQSMLNRVCPTCGGCVEMQLVVCEDHDAEDGICDACGTRFLGRAHLACTTCKDRVRGPSWTPVINHPAVVAFFYDHGIEHNHASWAAMARGDTCREELVSTDPIRMRITVPAGEDELVVTVDGSLTVVNVENR